MTETVRKAADISIPDKKASKRKIKLPYWNDKCKEAVRNKRRAKRRMKNRFDLQDCIEFRKTRATAQRVIREEQQNSWRKYCTSLNDKSKLSDIWRISKKMAGTNTIREIPTLKVNGQKCVTKKEKADAIAEVIRQSSSNENYGDKFQERKKKYEEEKNRHDTEKRVNDKHPELNEVFQFHELDASIRHGKKNKSPGEDRIHYEMLQHLPKCSKKILLRMYNDVWTDGTLPPSWKHSIILPFLKPKKDASNPNSYRPIALTSTLCKVMEGMITNRLQWFMEKHNLFNPDQAGFRKGRCTVDHIMRLQNDVQAALNHGHLTVGVFLDFSKAFDMMWKGGVMEKLTRIEIGGKIFNWIDDFLSDRTFQVQIGDQLSDTLQMDNGTPQGSRLSPLLFLIQINDFPNPEVNTKQAIYADDSSIWKTGPNLKVIMKKLQIDLYKIEKWCDEWGFTLSTEKTIGVIFSHHHKQPETPALRICGKEIKIEDQVKFLGVIFDRRLNWGAHINYVVDRCKKVLNVDAEFDGTEMGSRQKELDDHLQSTYSIKN